MENGRKVKAVGALTVISAIITLISAAYNFLLPMYLLNKIQSDINIREAGSIGIIGGADGPTAIYVSGHSSMNLVTAIFALITIAGLAYLILLKKHKT